MRQVELKSLVEALDVLCPMHVLLSEDGEILDLGPTARKIVDMSEEPTKFQGVFSIRKPVIEIEDVDFQSLCGRKLYLQIRGNLDVALTGVMMPIGEGYLLNLSLGLDVVASIQRLKLSLTDFAPTDASTNIVYLSEAKSTAIDEYKRLSRRLNGEKSKAQKEATTDPLTGLLNARGLNENLDRLITAREAFAVMVIDLDYFKDVNDTLGHLAGDHVLQVMARILSEETREKDLCARNGGDEFVAVLRGVKDPKFAGKIADRVIERISQPISIENAKCNVSASIGTSFSHSLATPTAVDILKKADDALYVSKRNGKGRNSISA